MASEFKDLSDDMQRTVVLSASTLAAAAITKFEAAEQDKRLPQFFEIALTVVTQSVVTKVS